MKCVVIKGKTAKGLESDINEWLNNNKDVDIKHTCQGGAGNAVLTTIFYE